MSDPWTRTWRAVEGFEAELVAAGAGPGYVRRFSDTPAVVAPTFDVALEAVADEPLVRELVGRADLIAIGIVGPAAPARAGERLAAGTRLELVDGTNAVCDVGWETSIFAVSDGPLTGRRIAFLDEVRWGFAPVAATTCLRRGARLDAAASERVLGWLATHRGD